ncbi:ABC transporter permease [Opitutus sp. ER46]|uniref:ABC transporter permease n=1 Tax=Opitutus sp. ER46 TaxID=2161864 RepID=UPI000D3037BE|nr:ABC transporter permease [Opitutus sp. ER46]PTX94420.1 hypothetical protein DB354_11765 [Opitutus sp. ER46]
MFQDLRLAFRQLAKSPGFAVVAILTLALGIGTNTAIFSLVQAVVLRPLPCPAPAQLVTLGEWSEEVPEMSIAYPNFIDWRQRQSCFTALGIGRRQDFAWVRPAGAERVSGSQATHDLFAALAVPPLRGRLFRPDDDRPGAARTALLGERFWRAQFAGRDSVIGEPLQLNGSTYTIVGVLPADIDVLLGAADVVVPLGLSADDFASRWVHAGMYSVARLKPGVSIERARSEMQAIAADLAREFPVTNARQSVTVTPLAETLFAGKDHALYVLLGAAGFVLLIGCANVANLQLARAQAREREFAIRAAVGASRLRLLRQLLIESLALGLLACLFGVLFAAWGLDGLRAIIATNLPRAAEVSLDARVLAFATGIGLLSSVLFGLAPALHTAKTDLRSAFVTSAGTAGTRSGRRWRTALVVGEFALTCLLVTGASLMLRTFAKLHHANLGYSVDHVVTFDVDLSSPAFQSDERRRTLIAQATERLQTIPAVSAAGAINPLPLRGANQTSYLVEGATRPTSGMGPTAEHAQVNPEFFPALGLTLVAGRGFNHEDSVTAPRVVIIDTLFAEKNFPGQNPLGKRIAFGPDETRDSDWCRVVGVVSHIRNLGVRAPTREQSYVPYTQSVPTSLSFALRTNRDAATLAADIRAVMHGLAPDLPVFNVRTMADRFAATLATERLSVVLLGLFGALALVLAAVGLYGVINYIVGQRTREIGVRIALGATPGAILNLLLRYGLGLAGGGLLIGLVTALALTQFLRSLLYEVSPFDPLSFAAVALMLALLGLAACWIPARRAAQVNPVDALRAD